MSGLLPSQVKQLLQPINPKRVLQANKHSHVSQQDIAAHLIRVFGFGAFDVQVLETECVFETCIPTDGVDQMTDKAIHKALRYDVCYRALVRLTVRDSEGNTLAVYENGSTDTAQNQTRGDAHDLAYKSAISLSVKRCAIFWGDQFGLSLYNKGQLEGLVRGTLVGMPDAEEPPADMQEGVPQQVSLGNDETEPPEEAPEPEPAPEPVTKTEPVPIAKPTPKPAPSEERIEFDALMSIAKSHGQKERIGAALDNPKTQALAFAAWQAMDEEQHRLLKVIAASKPKP